jgi:hypothetical protein
VTEILPSERNGAAPERRLSRAALKSVMTPVASPGLMAGGGAKSAEADLFAFEGQKNAGLVGLRSRQ